MSTYNFNCPQCGKSIEADDSYSGMEAECPHCAKNIVIPQRPRVVLTKGVASRSGFVGLISSMTRREFWTLKRSIIVGQAAIALLLSIGIALLLQERGKGNSDGKEVKTDNTNQTRQTEVAETKTASLQSGSAAVSAVALETPSGKLLIYAEQGETSFVEKVLRENPALDVNRPRAEGNKTALYLACEKGYSDIVKLLLERKADATICDEVKGSINDGMKYSALTVAARNGNVEVVKLLLSSGVDKESRDDGNRTALYTAAANNKPKVVQCLCEAKANANAYGRLKLTPLAVAMRRGNVAVIKVLLKHGDGVDLEMHVAEGLTPLFYAVEKNKPEIVEILCKAGAKVNVYGGYNQYWTPLTKAAIEGYTEVVRSLLKYGKGIDLEMRAQGYPYNGTPLYLAALRNHAEVVDVLCDSGADLEARGGPFDNTPIEVAVSQKSYEAEKVLRGFRGERKGEEKIGEFIWSYSASKGRVIIKGVSPKADNIVIPQKIGKYAVTAIGEKAFGSYGDESKGIKSVTIPEGVTIIEKNAFENCSGLTSVTIPASVTSIGKFAFSGCEGLKSVDLPASLTSIEGGTFEKCKSLQSVKIPSTVTNVGYHAFYGCSELTAVEMPNGVAGIGDNAFADCCKLKTVDIPDSVKSVGNCAFKGCKELTNVAISRGMTNIAVEVFAGCKSLTSVTIPETVKSIGTRAFFQCGGLKHLVIPDSVSTIGFSAYEDCSNLERFTLGKGVRNIEACAFKGCRKLFNKDFMILGNRLCGYVGSSRDVTIPNCVTSIEGGAFYECKELKRVKIPPTVTVIKGGAFNGCKGLTSVSFPNGVTSIDNGAFKDCAGLTSLELPTTVTTIGARAFSGCEGLTSVTIPASVTSIGDWAFSGCRGLTSVTIPNAVTNIGESAFSLCHFKKVKIPDSVISIGKEAFGYCVYLKDVSIPEAFADEISSMFSNCPDLSKMIDMRGVDVRNVWISSDCFRKEAEEGNARAEYYMGMWCLVEDKDITSGIKWLIKSASKGHAGAMFQLGQCNMMAWSSARDGQNADYLRSAKEWYRKAMAQGHGVAETMWNMLLKTENENRNSQRSNY